MESQFEEWDAARTFDGDGGFCFTVVQSATRIPPERVREVVEPYFALRPDGLRTGDAVFFVAGAPDAIAKSPEDGGIFNLPAVFIVLAITLLLVRGVTESARVNFVMVIVKPF